MGLLLCYFPAGSPQGLGEKDYPILLSLPQYWLNNINIIFCGNLNITHNIKMKNKLQIAVENENEQSLINALSIYESKKINLDSYHWIELALIGTWHSRHEDLVNIIYLQNLRDDRFIEPIVKIALNKDIFRWYDDEMEATLRKCVHALKTLDSIKANEALEILINMNNENVIYALDMYK